MRVLDASLRLLHPFTPFVTEELWQFLKKTALSKGFSPFDSSGKWEDALIIAAWPEAGKSEGWEEGKIAEFALIQDLIRGIRNLRAEKKVKPGKKIPATIAAGAKLPLLNGQQKTLSALAGLDAERLLIVETITDKIGEHVSLVVAGLEIQLALSDLVDEVEEKGRIEKELLEVTSQIERLEKLLSSDFGAKAPPQVVEKEKVKLKEFKETREKLESQQK